LRKYFMSDSDSLQSSFLKLHLLKQWNCVAQRRATWSDTISLLCVNTPYVGSISYVRLGWVQFVQLMPEFLLPWMRKLYYYYFYFYLEAFIPVDGSLDVNKIT
jgi:hypothetical protein